MAPDRVAERPVDELCNNFVAAQMREQGLEPAPMAVPAPDVVFCTVVRLEPESSFAFRWVPFGIELGIPAGEPTTLVEFTLNPAGEGTELLIAETGFDALALPRRRRAFLMNTGGWEAQADNLRRYVDGA